MNVFQHSGVCKMISFLLVCLWLPSKRGSTFSVHIFGKPLYVINIQVRLF